MIWKLPHPVRGLATFVVVYALGGILGGLAIGFALGMPELAVLATLSAAAGLVVATRTNGDRKSVP